jgi:hypothetical protein
MTTVISIVLLARLLVPAPAADDVRFFWAAQLARGEGASARYSVLTEDVVATERGDRIRFYLSPAAPAHVYVLNAAQNGSLEVLFPDAGRSAAVDAGAEVHLPSGGRWFVVDQNSSRERVHLIVAAAPLGELERALQTYGQTPQSARGDAAAAVMAEIGRLRRVHGAPPPRATRPAVIAGTYRSSAPDIAATAVEVKAVRFYARTYILGR